MTGDDKRTLSKEFHETVNMSVKELEKWLDDPKSMETGQADSDGEPKGHKSGKQIVELLKKKESDWTDDDYTHVKHVLAYCKRHLKQGNSKDPEHSKWRYSLMNWGHDPLKTKRERSRSASPAKSPKKGKAAEKEKSPEKKAEAKGTDNGAAENGGNKSPKKGAESPKKSAESPKKAESPTKAKK